jgi:GNAT superfamily N-acetyltransferase
VIQVRDASAADEQAIAELYVTSRRVAWRGIVDAEYLDGLDIDEERHDLFTALAPPEAGWRVLVGEEEGRVVGFVTFVVERRSQTGHVGALFVSPERFSSGIGTALLNAAATALAYRGCGDAILWTLEDDPNVIAFYQRRGWVPDGGRQLIELDQKRPVLRLRRSLSERATS